MSVPWLSAASAELTAGAEGLQAVVDALPVDEAADRPADGRRGGGGAVTSVAAQGVVAALDGAEETRAARPERARTAAAEAGGTGERHGHSHRRRP